MPFKKNLIFRFSACGQGRALRQHFASGLTLPDKILPAHNKGFLQAGQTSNLKVLIFVSAFVRGTGLYSKIPARQKAPNRYA